MMFVVQFEDVYADDPARLPERAFHMPAHLAFLAAQADRIIAAGALRAAPDADPLGGMWIVNADNADTVEALTRADPFWQAGLRRSVSVSRWARALWSPEFGDCVARRGAGGSPAA